VSKKKGEIKFVWPFEYSGKMRTELPFLYSLVLFVLSREYERTKTCVEVGVAKGGAAECICRALKELDGGESEYWGFDAWKRYGQGNEFKALGSREVVSQRLDGIPFGNYHLYEVDSIKEREKFRELCPDNIDFAFIDGDHSYKGIANDFSVIYPKLAPMGVIAFHDTCNIDGCREFMLDLRTKLYDGTFDLLEIPLGNGKNNRHPGISILMKRYHFVEEYCIDEINGSVSDPDDIETKEMAWLHDEVRKHDGAMDNININPEMNLTRSRLRKYMGRVKFTEV
jgi:hypothetical protein